MAETDVSLTFDPNMWQKGVDAMVGRLDALEGHLLKVSDNTTKMEKTGARSIGIWTAVASKALGILGSAASAIMGFIPEIGYSFKVAGDIISRNLLWPLRQELIPLLQGMLNWVRDHRATFVKWGGIIANVFRVIKQLVIGFWEIFQRIWERVTGWIKKIFGNTTKSISDIINMALFRIAVLAIGIQQMIEPIIDFLVDAFMTLVRYANAFITGFMQGIKGIDGPIGDILENIKKLGDLFNEIGGSSLILNMFKAFGTFVGVVLKNSLEIIAGILETIIFSVRILKALFSGDWPGAKKLLFEYGGKQLQRGKNIGRNTIEGGKDIYNTLLGDDEVPTTPSGKTDVKNDITVKIDKDGNASAAVKTKVNGKDLKQQIINSNGARNIK
jgi:hypothetical protein